MIRTETDELDVPFWNWWKQSGFSPACSLVAHGAWKASRAALATAPPVQADFALPEQRDLTPEEQKALRRVYARLYKPVAMRHGYDCVKVRHETKRNGYLHDDLDDGPYDVDAVLYCGRCHIALPKDSLARKGPSPELGNADAPGHPSPTHPGERSTAQADRSSPESLPLPQPASDGALAYANELIEDFLANEECGCAKGVYPHPCPRCIVTIEEARKYIATCTVPEAALASHDQKVRAETLAEIAPLIMEHRYIRDGGSSQCRCAKIVFHGQSWDDDFKSWWEHIRSLAGAVEKK